MANVIIKGGSISNAGTYGIFLQGVNQANVDDISISGSNDDGLRVNSRTGYAPSLTIRNCNFESNEDNGIFFNTGGTQSISYCNFINQTTSIRATNSGNTSVDNCYISHSGNANSASNPAIRIQSGTYLLQDTTLTSTGICSSFIDHIKNICSKRHLCSKLKGNYQKLSISTEYWEAS